MENERGYNGPAVPTRGVWIALALFWLAVVGMFALAGLNQ